MGRNTLNCLVALGRRFSQRSAASWIGCIGTMAGVLLLGASLAGAAVEKEKSADPLGDVAQDMKAASRWLAKLSTDVLTRETQKDAVDKLDTLIADLEKECEKCKGSRSPANPSKPAADSVIKSGPGGMGKMHSANDDGKHWADLPPHEREKILQSMNDGFPAHYQGVLAAYFKRLAEEKPVQADESPTPSASSAPVSNAAKATPETTVPATAKPAADAK
jgi:hypothetical protein